MNYLKSADVFIQHKHLFQLGVLPTEQSHPKTKKLSYLAQNDLATAVEVLRQVDQEALQDILSQEQKIEELSQKLGKTLQTGHRVFLCGCGATGRLSLSLEWLFRQQDQYPDQVISLMAGGDVALVHSIEGFEDYPQYGARHLEQLGFSEGDLLIASTEGGETPYVIGAAEWAAKTSSNSPYFLYCNPDEVLVEFVERSRRILDNPKIKKINLCVGPMALAGSTRMQASTVLQFAIGYAFESALGQTDNFKSSINRLLVSLKNLAISDLESLIKKESRIYENGEFILYSVDGSSITVFTDTTERAPTFSLAAFTNPQSAKESKLSYCYVLVNTTNNSQSSWKELLGRSPRALNWSDINIKTCDSYLAEFDFSNGARDWRESLSSKKHHIFKMEDRCDEFIFQLDNCKMNLKSTGLSLFERQILLKMVLNIHSTLVMGRLDRYKSNMMTWVSPSNGKLIDRSSRYLRALAEAQGCELSEDQSIRLIFESMTRLQAGESVVLKALQKLTT